MPFAAGRRFLDKYETVRLLGEGGMGAVYLARTLQGDEPVVVKVMHDHIARDAQFRERFAREIELMARFQHEHAVGFLDSGDDPSGPCLVMEFVPGITMDKLIARNGRFSPVRIWRIVTQLCTVLQAAHEVGIIHRDLKPVNLMVLDPDTPFEKLRVMDFGLAEMAGPPTPGAAKQYAVGTPGYMSPEQVAGNPTDHRSDIYSVGAIIYQLLTGRLPFPGETTMEILMAQATKPPPSFAGLGVVVPAAVEDLVLACLAVEPAERPASAGELGEIYEAALRQNYGGAEEAEAGPWPTRKADAPPAAVPPTEDEPTDPNAYVETLESYMPEASAVYKVRAFVEEVAGKVLDVQPGVMRVWLRAPTKSSGSGGFLGMLGLARKVGPIEVELRMRHKDTDKKGLLHITLRFHTAGGGKLPDHPDWQARCRQIHRALKSFLMSQS